MKLHLIFLTALALVSNSTLPSRVFKSDSALHDQGQEIIANTRTKFGSMIDFVLSQGAPHVHTWPSDIDAINIIQDRYARGSVYQYLQDIQLQLHEIRSMRFKLSERCKQYKASYLKTPALMNNTVETLIALEQDLQAAHDYIAHHSSSINAYDASYFHTIQDRYKESLYWLNQIVSLQEKSFAQYKLSSIILTDYLHASNRKPFTHYMNLVLHDINWLTAHLNDTMLSASYHQINTLVAQLRRLVEFIRHCSTYAQEYYS